MPTLHLTTKRGEEFAEIGIRDNGTGMPPEVIEKIFLPFFTTKPTDKGTGLGLAMCADIIRKHGGTIDVQSEPNEYTEMIIALPLTPPIMDQGQLELRADRTDDSEVDDGPDEGESEEEEMAEVEA
jgi:signal transduction histidine kinase